MSQGPGCPGGQPRAIVEPHKARLKTPLRTARPCWETRACSLAPTGTPSSGPRSLSPGTHTHGSTRVLSGRLQTWACSWSWNMGSALRMAARPLPGTSTAGGGQAECGQRWRHSQLLQPTPSPPEGQALGRSRGQGQAWPRRPGGLGQGYQWKPGPWQLAAATSPPGPMLIPALEPRGSAATLPGPVSA